MENTNDNLAAVSLHESAHPRDEQSFKQLQVLALIKGIDLVCETLCVFDEIRNFPENASNDVKIVIEKLYALRYCIQDMIISRNGRV